MKQVSDTATLPKNPGSQPSRWPKFNFSPRRGGTETINVANLDRPICQKDPMLGNYASVPIALKQILVPTDLKEESQKAVSYGLVLAHSFTAHLTLLHVYREPYSVDYLRGPQACAAVSRLRRDSEIALATLLQQVAEQYADCSAEFRYGSVCEEIVKSARFTLRANAVLILERLVKQGDSKALQAIKDALLDSNEKVKKNAEIVYRTIQASGSSTS